MRVTTVHTLQKENTKKKYKKEEVQHFAKTPKKKLTYKQKQQKKQKKSEKNSGNSTQNNDICTILTPFFFPLQKIQYLTSPTLTTYLPLVFISAPLPDHR